MHNTICVMGLGYIGLPTASLLATKGFQVLGCDVNAEIVKTINQGKIHIVEKDLDILVRSAIQSGQLKAATTPQPADIYIIAVPTPFKENRLPDLHYVEKATLAISAYIQDSALIILESTSPVGTSEKINHWIKTLRPELKNIYIAHCPERVLPGHILRELVDNDRIIGGIDQASAQKAKDFYQSFVQGNIFLTDARTAEMSKLTENAFRDVNIAFANELAMICEQLNINVWELIRLANHHPRVNILQPGPGVGGHCIAVDPWFIVDAAPQQSALIRTARQVNDRTPYFILEQVIQAATAFSSPQIACLGLSFKANIDDLRESPALQIVLELAKKNIGYLSIVEPHIQQLPKALQNRQPEIELVEMNFAIEQADIILLLVDHKLFGAISRNQLQNKKIIDPRGFWNK